MNDKLQKMKSTSTQAKTHAKNNGVQSIVKRSHDLKWGKHLAEKTSSAFWDSLNARNDNDLECLLAWAKEMSNTNCGWHEFALKEVLMKVIPDIQYFRSKVER